MHRTSCICLFSTMKDFIDNVEIVFEFFIIESSRLKYEKEDTKFIILN